jgi:Zinc carboxypeptidase/GEVED domain/Secretion system C-terminal sorting domain/Fibronectin type III domain
MKMKFYLPAIVIIFFILVTTTTYAQRMKYHRITAVIPPEKLELLFSKGLEVDHFGYENKKDFTAELSVDDLILLKKNNVKFSFLVEDLEKNLEKFNKEVDRIAPKSEAKNAKVAVTTPSNFTLGTYGGYFTFAELQTILDKMRMLYPNLIAAKSSIGTSIEGRPILMVKISDNPDVDEAEPEMFFNAVHHAREPMSMSQLIFFMWHILENYNTDKDIKTLVNSTELYIVPCVNPDGYVYNQGTNPSGGGMWRKNRRNNGNGTYGVDPNRNYAYKWGYDNTGSSPTTSSDTYRGTAAFSEPETQVIRDFCNSHAFSLSFDFHSYGNFCIHPYGYTATNPNPEVSIFQQMGTFFVADNGFISGTGTQTVNYTSNGGGDDWKYGEQTTKSKIYSFTPEVGPAAEGFYPASSRIIPICNTTIEMNKKAFKVGSFFAKLTTPPTTALYSTTGAISYSIQNFSVKPATYTVSITPLSSYVISTGATKTYSSLTLLQSQADNIAFTLDPATPYGTYQFAITLDNGLSPQTDTVTVNYQAPVPCIATTSLSASNITSSAATINWSAVASVNNYTVEYKLASSSTWIVANSAVTTTNYVLSGLTASTLYDYRVKANCPSGSSPYTAAQLTTGPAYCASIGANLTYMWTDLVQLGTINRVSGKDGGYYNGTAISTNAVRGSSQTITFSSGFTNTVYRMYWRVWIDFNKNGVFTDAGEQVLSTNVSTSGNTSAIFTIPNTALLGTTRMRVSSKYGAYPTPCETFTYGEVEDYSINIIASTPVNIIASAREGQPEIAESNEAEIMAYPNPVSDIVTIRLNYLSTSNFKTVKMISGNGTEIGSQEVELFNNEFRIDTKKLNTGMYFISVQEPDRQRVVKIIKE